MMSPAWFYMGFLVGARRERNLYITSGTCIALYVHKRGVGGGSSPSPIIIFFFYQLRVSYFDHQDFLNVF